MIVALQQQKIKEILANPLQFPSSSAKSNDKTAVAAAAGMPKSCEDLRYLGHAASGLYLIMGTKQVETVYCDFTALPSDPSKIAFKTKKYSPKYSITMATIHYRFPDVDWTS